MPDHDVEINLTVGEPWLLAHRLLLNAIGIT
jgi:hypothetical protein